MPEQPTDLLRAAATRLRDPLPGDLNATPRLVMTDAETVSGIAFCVDHLLPLHGKHQYSACDHCEVIDCLHEKLAELVHALLISRESLAVELEQQADIHKDIVRWECVWLPALAVARAVLGTTP